MKKIRRKLVLLSTTIMMLLIALTSTTYAFIVLNDEANISQTDFEIASQDGLLLSLDGKNFYQDLSYEQIAKAIIEAQGGTYSKDNDRVLDNFSLSGVSLAMDGASIALDNKLPSFVKDVLVAKEDNLAQDTLWYEHAYEQADANSYITFDIWAKVMTNAVEASEMKNYELYFTDRTAITGKGHEVTLVNSLQTADKSYKFGETILVNPADAMRIAVVNEGAVTVFEPNAGLGSAAVSGRTGVNDPTTNAMLTYYNNTHPLSPMEAAQENAQFDTVKDKLTETVLGAFTYTHVDGQDLNDNYNVVKLTVMIYLDGWDADYFMGINTSELQVKLGFEIREKQ